MRFDQFDLIIRQSANPPNKPAIVNGPDLIHHDVTSFNAGWRHRY